MAAIIEVYHLAAEPLTRFARATSQRPLVFGTHSLCALDERTAQTEVFATALKQLCPGIQLMEMRGSMARTRMQVLPGPVPALSSSALPDQSARASLAERSLMQFGPWRQAGQRYPPEPLARPAKNQRERGSRWVPLRGRGIPRSHPSAESPIGADVNSDRPGSWISPRRSAACRGCLHSMCKSRSQAVLRWGLEPPPQAQAIHERCSGAHTTLRPLTGCVTSRKTASLVHMRSSCTT